MRKIFVVLAVVFSTLITFPANAIEVVKIASMTYSLKSSTVTITTTATAIPATALAGREAITIRNLDASTKTVYIGGSDVTTANGFPLDAYIPAHNFDYDDSVIVYGIVATGTAEVRILEAK